jgi:hypothetical protein
MYFSDFKKARDQLVAHGHGSSTDAIRAALGDTGSKITIHKYMRELDAEDGVQGHSVSEEWLAIVAKRAEQLKLEAGREVEAMQARMDEMRVVHDTEQAKAAWQLADERKAAASVSEQFAKSEAQVEILKAQLHAEQISRNTAEQYALDMKTASRTLNVTRHRWRTNINMPAPPSRTSEPQQKSSVNRKPGATSSRSRQCRPIYVRPY